MSEMLGTPRYGYALGLLILLCTGVSGFVYWDYLAGSKWFLFADIGSDTINTFLPKYVHLADYLRMEGWPAWSFYQGVGQNLFPNSVGNPFTLFLSLIGAENIPSALVWVEIAKIISIGVLFFLYCRLLGFREHTALLGGLLVAFSAFVILGGTWYVFSTQALLFVLLLYSYERANILRSFWLLPLATMLIATSKAFYLYPFAIFMLVYSVFRFMDAGEGGWREFGVFLPKAAGWGALGVAMGAVFFIPNALEVLGSPRAAGEASSGGRLMDAPVFGFGNTVHNVTAILRVFSSDSLGTADGFRGWQNYLEAPMFYCGLISLLLAPQAFVFLDSRRRVWYAVVAVLFVIPVVFPFFRYSLWLYAGDYYRISSFFIAFMLLFFALKAVDRITSGQRVNVALLGSTLAVLLAVLYYPYTNQGSPVEPGIGLQVGVFLAVYSVLIFLSRIPRFRAGVSVAALTVVIVELAVFSSVTVNDRAALPAAESGQYAGYDDGTAEAVRLIQEKDPGLYRIEKTYSSGAARHASLNDAKVQRYRGTSSYHSFNQRSYIEFLSAFDVIDPGIDGARWIPRLTADSGLLSFASVKYVLSKSAREAKDLEKFGFRKAGRIGDVIVSGNRTYLPIGFLYDTYMKRREFDTLEKRQKRIALYKAAVLEENDTVGALKAIGADDIPDDYSWTDYTRDIADRRAHTMAISTYSNTMIRGRVDVPRPALLQFTIPYDRGWQARVDGQEAGTVKSAVGFTGILLGPGQHDIEIRYQLPYFGLSMSVTVLAWLFFALIAYARVRRGRQQEKSAAAGDAGYRT